VILPPGALLFGLVIAAPTVWGALFRGTVPVDVALPRVLVVLLVTSAGWLALQRLVRAYTRLAIADTDDRERVGSLGAPTGTASE
jgi:hypothetical protein